ncbi:MAG: ABC transporter, ATP-binding/permease protein [candidate division WWE3 bacterium GW2011_GWF1_42_14]|uniref:ABC transporter, ATP-binding/permease protein n=2 Tax=Bacteria candidate phyla TaxID=1783234 RepID=A0A0G0T8S1_9BACT|nr:MAG: ABC transporter, ATP-binding/permease protein [Candidatus Woesebacteria bacterium GW2011_GWB1_40_12]KKS37284.1 MAG: ABC transporter, ATP-binding/permease protein [candidate division WWE3 bacterium GW2011_GWF1_42_14]
MDTAEKVSRYETDKVDLNEFVKITKWALATIYRVHPVYFSLLIGTSIIRQWNDIVYTYIFAKAVDELIKVAQMPGASLTFLYPYIFILFGYSVFQTLINFLHSYSNMHIRTVSGYQVRKQQYKKIQSLGTQTLEIPEVNNTINRTNEYLGSLLPYTQESISFLASIVKMITTISITVSFMPLFAPLIIATSIPYLLFDKSVRKKIYKFDYDNTETRRVGSNIMMDLTSSVRLHEININNAFNYLDRKYSDIQDFLINKRLEIFRKGRIGGHAFGFLNDLVIIGGYIQIFKQLIAKVITVGDTVFWMRALNILQNSITNVIREFNDLFELSLQLKETYKLFRMEPAFEDGKTKLGVLSKGPSIDFNNISFSYPGTNRTVIENLTLNVKPGEKIAIVGQNGAGKTTLIKLLSRFYRVSNGQILVNGVVINEIEIDTLYQNMGVLFQDYNSYPFLSVKDNIYLGNPNGDLDMGKIQLAARAADADNFIEKYDNKYDQILSEKFKGGIRPSTGQWQKLALARFFYRNSPIVVFDEPTASIDPVSEYNIFNKIYEFFKNKTVIIVSHRFSTVRNADRIVVMENGQIIESGSHETLMAQNGNYANAFKLQAQGYTV